MIKGREILMSCVIRALLYIDKIYLQKNKKLTMELLKNSLYISLVFHWVKPKKIKDKKRKQCDRNLL